MSNNRKRRLKEMAIAMLGAVGISSNGMSAAAVSNSKEANEVLNSKEANEVLNSKETDFEVKEEQKEESQKGGNRFLKNVSYLSGIALGASGTAYFLNNLLRGGNQESIDIYYRFACICLNVSPEEMSRLHSKFIKLYNAENINDKVRKDVRVFAILSYENKKDGLELIKILKSDEEEKVLREKLLKYLGSKIDIDNLDKYIEGILKYIDKPGDVHGLMSYGDFKFATEHVKEDEEKFNNMSSVSKDELLESDLLRVLFKKLPIVWNFECTQETDEYKDFDSFIKAYEEGKVDYSGISNFRLNCLFRSSLDGKDYYETVDISGLNDDYGCFRALASAALKVKNNDDDNNNNDDNDDDNNNNDDNFSVGSNNSKVKNNDDDNNNNDDNFSVGSNNSKVKNNDDDNNNKEIQEEHKSEDN
jgi:hypothetical protein